MVPDYEVEDMKLLAKIQALEIRCFNLLQQVRTLNRTRSTLSFCLILFRKSFAIHRNDELYKNAIFNVVFLSYFVFQTR